MKTNRTHPKLISGITSSPSGLHSVPSELVPTGMQSKLSQLALISPHKQLFDKESIPSRATKKLLFCQETASAQTSDCIPLQSLASRMNQTGWSTDESGKLINPIDVIQKDGAFITLDNRRPIAASMDNVKARLYCHVHNECDALPSNQRHRFPLGSGYANTFGEAVESRLEQNFKRKTSSQQLPYIRGLATEEVRSKWHKSSKEVGFFKPTQFR